VSWPLVELGTVAQINPRLPQGTDEAQDVSFLAMASVSEDGLILNQESRTLSETKKGFTYFERNDVLLAKITPCFENGKAVLLYNLNHQIGFGSTEFHVLRPLKDKLDAKYLFYMVWSDRFRFFGEKAMKGAAGQKRISTDFLKEFKIPLPPLNEQKRIATILDKADSLRRKRQQAIQLADQFLLSVFLDLFGDPVMNPKGWDVGCFSDICMLNPQSKKYEDDLLVSFVPMQRVSGSSSSINLEEKRPYSEVKKGFTVFIDGDVLFAKITPCMENGKAGIALKLENGIGFGSTEFHVFRPYESVYAEFIYSLVHLDVFRKLCADNFSGAVGHKRVPKDFLAKFPLYLPPLKLINKFSVIFNRVNALSSKLEGTGFHNTELFNSLSQKAFAGEL